MFLLRFVRYCISEILKNESSEINKIINVANFY